MSTECGKDVFQDSELRQAAEAAGLGWYFYDFVGATGTWSDQFKTLFGLPVDQNVSIDEGGLFALIFPDDRAGFLSDFRKANDPSGSGTLNHEVRVELPDGSIRWLMVRGQTTFAGQGMARFPVKSAGVVIDISKRKQAEETLRESEEKWRGLFEILPVGVSIVNSKNGVSDINPALGQILGLSLESILKGEYQNRKYLRSDKTIMPVEEFPSIRAVKEQTSIRNVEIGIEKEDGSFIWTSVSATPLDPVASSATVTVDITELKRLEEQLRHLATTDELTGISNRRHFLEMASHELKHMRRLEHPLSVALIDIDHFKFINDAFGHAVGDQVLVAFANICKGNIRETDLLARFGGDEFAILLPDTRCENTFEVIERIRLSLDAHPMELGGMSIPMTISAGIICSPLGQEPIDRLLSRADKALYDAKEAGRNVIVVNQEM
jgi:diguanylate cyclase (GGDEF)-like protein/PAS domain S-box-containing protein